MTIVWVVKYRGFGSVLWDRYIEAWTDLKTNEFAVFLYPKLIRSKKLNQLKEFNGF